MEMTFKSLPLKFFYSYENTLCDVYLRLGDEKFVKIVNSGDSITNDVLRNFENKNITSFYVLKKDFDQFGMELVPHSAAPVVKDILPDHKELNALLGSLGINLFTCSEVSKTYEKFLSDISTNKHISNLLKQMIFNKKRFTYDHSYLAGIISIELAKKFEWSLTSVKEKLMIAAIMHDLRMPEDIVSIADSNNLSDSVAYNILRAHLKHSELMAEDLSKEDKVAQDVINIIKDHHNLSSVNLTPLTMVFIVAHEFVIKLYNYQLNPEMGPQALRDIEVFFKGSVFEKYVIELSKIIKSDPLIMAS